MPDPTVPVLTDVTIANLALIRCTGPQISTTGLTAPATQLERDVAKIFPLIKNVCLQKVDWNFARNEVDLVEDETNDFAQWTYSYAKPTDCLTGRYLYNALQPLPNLTIGSYFASMDARLPVRNPPFEIRDAHVGTDMTPARLYYTKVIAADSLSDPLFIDALVSRLAAEFSQTVLPDRARYADQMSLWKSLTGDASDNSINESVDYPITTNTFVSARY